MKHLRQYIRQILLEMVDDEDGGNVAQAWGWVTPQDARFGSKLPLTFRDLEGPPPPDPDRYLGRDAYPRTSQGKLDPVLSGVHGNIHVYSRYPTPFEGGMEAYASGIPFDFPPVQVEWHKSEGPQNYSGWKPLDITAEEEKEWNAGWKAAKAEGVQQAPFPSSEHAISIDEHWWNKYDNGEDTRKDWTMGLRNNDLKNDLLAHMGIEPPWNKEQAWERKEKEKAAKKKAKEERRRKREAKRKAKK